MTATLTNKLALQAAQARDQAGAALARTRDRLSTGLKVASAKDNGATWSIGRRMTVEAKSFGVANDSLARGSSMLDVAVAGVDQIHDMLTRAREKALALKDPSLNQAARTALSNDIKALVDQVNRTATQAEFDGKRPLADQLSTTTVTYTSTSYSPPTSALTPPELAAGITNTSGTAAQTFVRDGGSTAGRIDLYLDAFSVPDVLEIWQGGQRRAATGQAYVAGGGAVGTGQAVSGPNILSFDYDPLNGQALEFRFNENGSMAGTAWSVGGVVMQPLGAPMPALVSNTVTVPGVTISTATRYDFVASPDGDTLDIGSQPLTAEALHLDTVDWDEPGAVLSAVEAALETTQAAGLYFGQRQNLFADVAANNSKTADALTTGVGNLVDADLNKEAALLKAGEARQAMATTSLATANGQTAWLLALFG